MNHLYLIFFLVLLSSNCTHVDHSNPPPVDISSGTLERHEDFPSEYVASRNVDVWLPDGYSADDQYAVLYMHDGQMLYDSTKSWNKQEWGVDETMGQLIESGKIEETIVVGVWNTELRHSEYFPQKPFERLGEDVQDSLLNLAFGSPDNRLFKDEIQSDNYLKFLVRELKPFIDKNYATYPNAEKTFIAGSSMGGLISMYAICEYPEVFSGAACLSTHWLGTFDTLNNPIPAAFASYLNDRLPDPETHRIYFDFGTETLDAFYEPFQNAIDSIMVSKGYNDQNWASLKFEGEDHSERAWYKRLHIPITFLMSDEEQ
ncbi:MAG: alpha/beta hydrolase-fold protein [Bacteroidota bacterium]